MKSILFFSLLFLLIVPELWAQRENVIYEESKVPQYQLPDVLTRFKGGKVKTEKTWFRKQRPEILKLFTDEVYGRVPGNLGISEVKVWETADDAVNGLAIRKQFVAVFQKRQSQPGGECVDVFAESCT